MPSIITGHNDVLIVIGAANGGWCVYSGASKMTTSEIMESWPAAAVADDEGLIEWFADQLALPAPELQARPPNPGPVAKPAEHGAPPVAGDDQIKHMVDRFLSWRLPENFNPDGGISFQPLVNEGTQYTHNPGPTGTNLLDAAQAEAMIRHMLEGMPARQTAGEESYQRYRASFPAEFDGTRADLATASAMFERWIGDALPANEAGQVHFARALAESMSDAIKAYLKNETPPELDDSRTVHAVREALQPYVKLAIACRTFANNSICGIAFDPATEKYVSTAVGDLRALMRAADLWTDEMQAPAQDEGSAQKPEAGAPPPPAEGDDDAGDPVGITAADDDEQPF